MSRLGLRGEPAVDFRRTGDVLELFLAGAFLADNPGQSVTEAHPGDLVILWSNSQLNPDNTGGLCEAHPQLLQHGFCSLPHFLTEDTNGNVTVLFRCEREIDLTKLPYLVRVASLGRADQ
jgi:hypothetical protein